MSHDGKDGGAKAPIANRVEAPRAPTTNARREIAEDFVADAGALTEGEGAVLG